MSSVRTGPRDGATVVLIHAVGYDLTYWDNQIEALRPTYDVIAFDMPGHGRSPVEPDGWSFARITATVAQLARAADNGPVHVVGISFGGMVAQATALAYPELVRSLTLIGTAPTFPAPVRAGMRVRAAAVRADGMQAVLSSSLDRWFTTETRTSRPHLIDRVSKTVLGDDPATHAAIWDLIANEFDVVDRLGEITCPTLVLVGDQDPSTPPAVAAVMAAGIRGARMQVLPATSHMASIESPDAVNLELLRFLAAH